MTAYWTTGDTRDVTAHIPDDSIDLILTSPPFLSLRSYLPPGHVDKHREIGSEATPAAFVDTLLDLTAGWRRVLAPHGSLCVELGDTYSGSTMGGGDLIEGSGQFSYPKKREREVVAAVRRGDGWPEAKSLTLIPESYRFALAYGRNPHTGTVSPAGRWRVRNVITICKPNPPVGALGDKVRPATSDLVVACTARDRWFDLDSVRTEFVGVNAEKQADGWQVSAKAAAGHASMARDGNSQHHANLRRPYGHTAGAPPLDWWVIPGGSYSGAHYATFSTELCIKPIEAMCPRRVCTACGQPSRRLVEHGELEATADARIKAWDRGKNHDNDAATGGMAAGLKAGGFIPNHVRPATTTGWSSCGCAGADGLKLDGYHTGPGWRPGRVLDPFAGSGTVASVATGHSRDSISIDLDERNEHLARERVGMFMQEVTADGLADVLEQQTREGVA